jgi:DNA-binding response OmpR family regulator
LIVEDDADMRSALCDLLGEEPCRVVSAADGAAALRWMEHEVPALVVTDLGMPGMNGWDFIDQVRARDELRSVPVLVFSAAVAGQRASLPGTIGTFAKPDDLDRLVTAVRAVLAAAARRSSARQRPARSRGERRRGADVSSPIRIRRTIGPPPFSA